MLIFTIIAFYSPEINGRLGKNNSYADHLRQPTGGLSAVRQNGDSIQGQKWSVLEFERLKAPVGQYRGALFWGLCILLVGISAFGIERQLKTRRLSGRFADIKKDLKACNDELKKLGAERNWLVREIHHRVKNNLQVVMSLLNLQADYLTDSQAIQAIRNSHNRMYALALVHKKLYQAESLSSIDMEVYIQELLHHLHDEYQTTSPVQVILETIPMCVSIATAVPLALIINEAVSNTLQYAFPGHTAGEIRLTMKTDDEGFCLLRIADNGIGLPAESQNSVTGLLGTSLITGLSQQMRAKLEIKNVGGVVISLRFKNDRSETYPLTA